MDQFDTHHQTISGIHPDFGPDDRVAFVQSCWHRPIVDNGRDAFLAEMTRQGIPEHAVELFEVPGAFEIPLLAKHLAQSGRYRAVIACGFVVDGGIYRHEFVADAVIGALMSVQLETGIPIISAVLTPQHFHEHDEHSRFFAEHFVTKGTEAASACLAMLHVMRRVQSLALAA